MERQDGLKGKLRITVSPDRIGVLIGSKGNVKKMVEEDLNVKINVDSTTGVVEIEPKPGADITRVLKARDFVRAIAYGFSPKRALRLLDEMQTLEVIDLKEFYRRREDLVRVKGRIIGESGKARRMIEEMAGAGISIYDHYVAIIGDFEQARIAREAVLMLINGRQHRTVYNFLKAKNAELKRREWGLWLPS